MGCEGTRSPAPRHMRVHTCPTHTPLPVPRPGSARTSPAGSRWPGPGLSSPPGDRAGTAQGTQQRSSGTWTPPQWYPGDPRALHGGDGAAPGAVTHEGHGKQDSAAPHHGVWAGGSMAAWWPWLHSGHSCTVATGHGCTVATAAWWHWPQLHGGHGFMVATAAQWHRPQLPSGPRSRWLRPPVPPLPPAPAAAAGAHGWCPSHRGPRGSRLPVPRPRSPTSLAAGGTHVRRGPRWPWPVSPQPTALPAPLPRWSCRSPVRPRCHLRGRTGLSRGMELGPGAPPTPPAPRATGTPPPLPGMRRDQHRPRGTGTPSTPGTGPGMCSTRCTRLPGAEGPPRRWPRYRTLRFPGAPPAARPVRAGTGAGREHRPRAPAPSTGPEHRAPAPAPPPRSRSRPPRTHARAPGGAARSRSARPRGRSRRRRLHPGPARPRYCWEAAAAQLRLPAAAGEEPPPPPPPLCGSASAGRGAPGSRAGGAEAAPREVAPGHPAPCGTEHLRGTGHPTERDPPGAP